MRKSLLALATVMPFSTTSCGRRGCATLSRFCTCTWAMSGSVPLMKVRVICTVPLEREVESKYSRLSTPVSCCSITEVTVFSITSALAPG